MINDSTPLPASASTSRREFLARGGAAVAASALAGVTLPHVHAAANDTVQLAIIGSGNRGSGAVVNAMEGLKPWGKVVMNGIALDEMKLPALPLVSHSYQIVGSAHNSAEYLVEALEIVASGAVKPMIEVFPKERVAEAYECAASGAVRFKAVVTY